MEHILQPQKNTQIPLIALVPTQVGKTFTTVSAVQKNCLPLVSIGSTLEITPQLPYLTSVLDLNFKNISSEKIDTSLVLPKDISSAITSAKIFIGDKIIEMKLMDKALAQAKMKQSMNEGKTTALGEVITRSSAEQRLGADVFRFRIGNLPPDLLIRV